jgi:hypothetical protein
MPRAYASGVVPASADAVWSHIRDFNSLPGIVVERLLVLDDPDRSVTYEFVENPFGARRYIATLRVAPVTATGEAFVEWWAEFDAEAADEKRLTDFFADAVYGGGIAALGELFAAKG